MKTYPLTILLLTIFISCETRTGTETEKSEPLKNISYKPTGELEIGTLNSTEYRNDYFGFSFSCPVDKWLILNIEQYSERLANNKEDLNASDKTWERTTSNLYNLLTIEKKTSDSSAHRTQSISFTAEGLEEIPNVNSALEYLQYSEQYCKDHYSTNYPKYTITGMETGLIGNRPFLVQSITIEDAPGARRFQKTYSAQFDKYLLNILVNYSSETEQKDNDDILTQVKWD
ncbi:MAG: hypothetical protein HYZ14_13920 [Bacteroidetes bacterium]|nr:hypothetical protein [Bacteroidota bacterium]